MSLSTLRRATALTLLLAAGSMAQGPTLSPTTFLPGDQTAGPAAGDQSATQVARGGNQVLAVWEDIRTDLGSSGLQPGQGAVDIWAARLDVDGQLIDDVPIAVSQEAGDQTRPHVAWNGQHWLVTWVSQVPTEFFWTDGLHAARIAADGTLLDPTPIVVHTMPGSFNGELWDVASDGSGWTVFFKDWVEGAWQVRAVRIDTSGLVLDPTPINLFTVPSQPYNGDVVFAGDEYLLVWQHSNGVFGRIVDPFLAPTGSNFPIAFTTGTDNWPVVATDGTTFFVVWENSNTCCVGGGGKVYGTRIDHAGTVLDPSGILLSATTAGSTGRSPAVGWDGAQWVAAWTYPVGISTVTHVGRVSQAGVALDPGGARVDGVASRQSEAAVAQVPAGGALVLWTDDRSGGRVPNDVLASVVSLEGQATTPSVVSRGAPAQTEPDLVPNGNGYLAVYASYTSAGARVCGQLLDGFGSPLTPDPIEIAPRGGFIRSPEVAFDGTTYLVAWEDNDFIFARRLDGNLNLLDASPIAVMPGTELDVAAVGGTFLVVGTDAPTNRQFRYPFAARIRAADGALLDPTPRQIGSSFARRVAATAIGGRFLAAWQRHFSHDNPRANIRAALVDTDGTSPGSFIVEGPFTKSLVSAAVVSDGNIALVAWADATSPAAGPNLFARRVEADGNVLPLISLSAAADEQSLPALGWTGTEYLAAFQDRRNITFFVDDRKDIYGARVDANGSLVDPDGFEVQVGARSEILPAVAGGNGSGIIASAVLRDDEPFASYRIGIRVATPAACAGSAVSYGSGCPGTGGIVPTHGLLGCPTEGNGVTFTLRDAAGDSLAILAFGAGRGNAPIIPGCELLVQPVVSSIGGLPVSFGRVGGGMLDLPFVVPALPFSVTLTTQFFVLDSGAPRGVAATNGVETTFP